MIRKISKITTGLFLTAAIIFSSIYVPVQAAEKATSTDLASHFDTIAREYTGTSGNIKHYQYVDDSGKVVSTKNTVSNHARASKRASALPSSYDLRNRNIITSIKDQGVSGSCWAFAAIKSMESYLLLKNTNTPKNIDLSENHLSWYTYHPSTDKNDVLYNEGAVFDGFFSSNDSAYSEGGSSILAAFTLARWSGAVTESKAPFDASSDTALNSMATTMSKKNASLHYATDYKLTDAICYDDATIDQIKQAIIDDGAMSVAFYYNSRYNHTTASNGLNYYQTAVTSDKATDFANHCVTIVGWDDNYSKNNFGTAKPSSDGAWLIANSYGSDFGDNGYFWLSYEDPSLTEYYSFHAVSSDTYDNNYQYDAYGWGAALADSTSDSTIAANIFTANKNYTQSLKAVGLYTVTDNQPYTIKVYRNVTTGKPDSGTLAATVSGTIEFQGYHTVSLPDTISLDAGERFSIVLSYDNTTGNGYMPLEGKSISDPDCTITYTSHPGESYLYQQDDNGTYQWYDINSYNYNNIANNVCIKAFTNNESAVANNGTISLSKSALTLGKGESYTAKATIKSTDTSPITWSSSNPSVATINSSGKITAHATGKTKITATLSSGNSAALSVTVKKAPSAVSVSPAKKTLRRKKTVQIKVLLPVDSASNKITYTSSNKKVAKVNSSGKVTALKKGTATITVKTFNQKTAKVKVTVKK